MVEYRCTWDHIDNILNVFLSAPIADFSTPLVKTSYCHLFLMQYFDKQYLQYYPNILRRKDLKFAAEALHNK